MSRPKMYQCSSTSLALVLLCASRATALPQRLSPRQTGTARSVLPTNFPDPSLLEDGGAYYAFGTSGNGANIQVARSPAFDNPAWERLDVNPLPDPGRWTDGSANIWAPYVLKAGNGNYVAYYSAPPKEDSSHHCIGTATSTSITGPYTPSESAWTCPLSAGGAIDAAAFTDPKTGNLYITYKIDGNSISTDTPTPIMLQQVCNDDGITPVGDAITMIDKDANDGPLVEAPGIFFAQDMYYLLFSTHIYSTPEYDIRYAKASSITGPWEQVDPSLLHTDDYGLLSPGSAGVSADGKQLLFHATNTPEPNLTRYLYQGSISVNEDGGLSVSVVT